MSKKIIDSCEKILEEMHVADDVADFVRRIIIFECMENPFQFKIRYNKEFSDIVEGGMYK